MLDACVAPRGRASSSGATAAHGARERRAGALVRPPRLHEAHADREPDRDHARHGAIAAYEHGRDLPVPYLVLGDRRAAGRYAAYHRPHRHDQSARGAARSAGSAYPARGRLVPEIGLDAERATRTGSCARYLDASAERVRAARGQRGAERARASTTPGVARARRAAARSSRKAGLGGRDYTLDLQVQIPLAVRALEGAARCHGADCRSNDLDTHQNNARQSELPRGAVRGAARAGREAREPGACSTTRWSWC